jgi:uncharacterized repeat protein (TIGR04138 family)
MQNDERRAQNEEMRFWFSARCVQAFWVPATFYLGSCRDRRYIDVMPPSDPGKSLQEVVDAVGIYPEEAYRFVQQGLTFTVQKIHAAQTDPQASRHVSGRDLCEGLRELALKQWGLMARTVLSRWNITSTMDFGRIVFAMVEHDLLQKTENDRVEDFRQVFDFNTAFEKDYRIEPTIESGRAARKEKKS